MTDKEKETPKAKASPEAIAPREVQISDEERERVLDELFEQGYATLQEVVIPGRLSATFRTMGGEAQLTLEQEAGKLEGSTSFVIHSYSKLLLSKTLVSYGDQKFASFAEALEFLGGDISSTLIDKMVKIQNYFERQVRKATDIEAIEEHFFGTPSAPNE